MNNTEFTYWLQGYFEIYKAGQDITSDPKSNALTESQVQVIKDHLALTLQHTTAPQTTWGRLEHPLQDLFSRYIIHLILIILVLIPQ